jgi:hypothetical protein
MKRILAIALLFIAFKASAQYPASIPGQFADKYVGNRISAFGDIYKTEYDARTHTMFIDFGSKYLEKGVILKLTNDSKLEANNIDFKDLKGRFITVTGKLTRDKEGRICMDGDDPKTSITIQQSLAYN